MERVERKGSPSALDEVRELIGRTGVNSKSIPFEIVGIEKREGRRERVKIKPLLNPISIVRKRMDPLLPETILRRIEQGEWILEPKDS
ncbi:MAG TPA: hypothetical protein VMY36_04570 [Patescibacteria group bacterium]|nr:hypothetical protein [Patescibacteria group bacterium]